MKEVVDAEQTRRITLDDIDRLTADREFDLAMEHGRWCYRGSKTRSLCRVFWA